VIYLAFVQGTIGSEVPWPQKIPSAAVATTRRAAIIAIVNAAAEAYRGANPDGRWPRPYMCGMSSIGGGGKRLAAGVELWGIEDERPDRSDGYSRVPRRRLIRHVMSCRDNQRRGVGGELDRALRRLSTRHMLAALGPPQGWADPLLPAHGFGLVSNGRRPVLKTSWTFRTDR